MHVGSLCPLAQSKTQSSLAFLPLRTPLNSKKSRLRLLSLFLSHMHLPHASCEHWIKEKGTWLSTAKCLLIHCLVCPCLLTPKNKKNPIYLFGQLPLTQDLSGKWCLLSFADSHADCPLRHWLRLQVFFILLRATPILRVSFFAQYSGLWFCAFADTMALTQ